MLSADNVLPDLFRFLPPEGAVHFIGCGGAGCAPLAGIFHEKGFRVSGSDLEENQETAALRKLGIQVRTGEHKKENLPVCRHLLLVHTSAANPANPEIVAAREQDALILRRGEALAAIAALYPNTISVSGSHGKTSVTAMIAWSLQALGERPGFLIGGHVNTWDSSGSAGNSRFFITEGDESDGTHVFLRSKLAVVTNIEDDHVWSLGGIDVLENNFRLFADHAESLLYVSGPRPDKLYGNRTGNVVRLNTFEHVFSPETEKKLGDFQLQNMYTVLRALEMFGFDRKKICAALERFPGVGRRMTVHLDTPKLRVIEDYAHHPTELRASIAALRKTNPGRRLVLVFQPHRYARLERYFEDFVRELQAADSVYIVPVFAAWCADGKFTSETLAEAAGATMLSGSWDEMADEIEKKLQPGDTVGVIGAGDIRKILPYLCQPVSE